MSGRGCQRSKDLEQNLPVCVQNQVIACLQHRGENGISWMTLSCRYNCFVVVIWEILRSLFTYVMSAVVKLLVLLCRLQGEKFYFTLSCRALRKQLQSTLFIRQTCFNFFCRLPARLVVNLIISDEVAAKIIRNISWFVKVSITVLGQGLYSFPKVQPSA